MPVLDIIAWFLLVLWASLATGGLLLRASRPHRRRLPAWLQAASALTLLLLAWYGYLLTRTGTETSRYALGIAAAISFFLLGGHLAAGALASRRTLFGILAMSAGYLLFVVAVVQYDATIGGVRLLLSLLVGALAGLSLLWRSRRRDPLHVAAAAACTLLFFTAIGFAFGLALTSPRFGVLPAGVLLLVSSDLTLLIELTASPSFFPRARPSNADNKSWLLPSLSNAARLLRAPGQALIVVSIWSALQNPVSSQIPAFVS